MALTQLRYLVAIADSGLNITQAAERVRHSLACQAAERTLVRRLPVVRAVIAAWKASPLA